MQQAILLYTLHPKALEAGKAGGLLSKLEKIEEKENLFSRAKDGLCRLLYASEGQRMYDTQHGLLHVRDGLGNMFQIMETNAPVTAAPREEGERKLFYTQLAKGFDLIAKMLTDAFQAGEMDKPQVFACLETIGDGGHHCAGRWRQVLEEVLTGLSYRMPEQVLQDANPDRLVEPIKKLFVQARMIEGNRGAERFVDKYYPDMHHENRLHYITFFKRYLNVFHHYQLPVTMKEDSFLLSEQRTLLNKISNFLENYPMDHVVAERCIKLIKDAVKNDGTLYRMVLSDREGAYYRHKDKESYREVSEYLSEKIFFGYSNEMRREAVLDILLEKDFVWIAEKEMDFESFALERVQEFLHVDAYDELEWFLKWMPKEVLAELIQKNEYVLQNITQGGTLLIFAVAKQQLSIATFLLAQGANPNATDFNGRTALMFCRDLNTADLLLEKGARVDVLDQGGESAIHSFMIQGYTALIQRILEHNQPLNYNSEYGNKALLSAVNFGCCDTLRRILDKGADMHYCEEGETALMLAIMYRIDPIFDVLVERGANLNQMLSEDQQTPLMLAIRCGNIYAAKTLIEREVDLAVRDDRGNTAMENAIKHAIKQSRLEIMQMLAEKGQTFDIRHPDVAARLDWAVHWNHETLVEFLIENGQNANGHYLGAPRGGGDKTLLMTAAGHPNSRIPDLLIGKGIDLDVQDRFGRTALMFAVEAGNTALVRKLVDKGAGLHLPNCHGYTVLDIAGAKGLGEIEKMLRIGLEKEQIRKRMLREAACPENKKIRAGKRI